MLGESREEAVLKTYSDPISQQPEIHGFKVKKEELKVKMFEEGILGNGCDDSGPR